MGALDSPRYCMFCEKWGDHHTDRCPVTPDRDERLREATRRTEAELDRVPAPAPAPRRTGRPG